MSDAVGARGSSAGQILQLVRDQPVSRSDLARLTGLAATTISARLDPLLSHGYVTQQGDTKNQGRRPVAVTVNAEYGLVAAVHIGTHHTRIGILDTAGRLRSVREYDATTAIDVDEYLGWLTRELRGALGELDARADRPPLRGIGLSIPSPVDAETGRLVDPTHMPGWSGVEPVHYLDEAFGVPVLADNDATLMALGEHRMHYPDVQNMLYVKIGSAVGCGIVASGTLHRGKHGGAGEIGHMPTDTAYRRRCVCGRHNCLEACLGATAILAHLRERAIDVGSTGDLLVPGAFGVPEVREILEAAGDAMGQALGLLTDFFNPELIVLGGSLARSDIVVQALRVALYSRSLPLSTRLLIINPSINGQNATVFGAGHMVLNHVLSAESVDLTLAAEASGRMAPVSLSATPA